MQTSVYIYCFNDNYYNVEGADTPARALGNRHSTLLLDTIVVASGLRVLML